MPYASLPHVQSITGYYEPCSKRVRVCQLKKCWQLENWPPLVKVYESRGDILEEEERIEKFTTMVPP